MKMKIIIGLLAVIVIGVMIASFGNFVGNVALTSLVLNSFSGQEVEYDSAVCIYKNGELLQCKHNLLTTVGKNLTVSRMIGGAGAAVNHIAVSNGTDPNVSSTVLEHEIGSANGCPGLNRTQDTTVVNIGDGNWSYSVKFTSDCAAKVNTTGLFNNTATGGQALFAAASFESTAVTLQSSDELNITWYIFVT